MDIDKMEKRQQAEKKARELLPKRDNKIKVDTGYELVRQGKNQTLAVVIPIVADLLMREAELKKAFTLSIKTECRLIEKYRTVNAKYIENYADYLNVKQQLSASQKKEAMLLSRVEELEKENKYVKEQIEVADSTAQIWRENYNVKVTELESSQNRVVELQEKLDSKEKA